MSKKLLAQAFLISLTLILSIVFFNQIFEKDKNLTFKPKINDEVSETNLIESKSGSLDEENPDIIYLVDVEAKINFDKNDEIKVYSNKAVYNINNFDTEFIDNVELIYDDNKLTCKNILVKFSKNYAILSGDLVYNNPLTKLYADQMEVDLSSRVTKTSMLNKKDKIKIIHKK